MTGASSFTTSLGFTPICRIDRGDVDITSNFEDRLISITITSSDGGGVGDQCDIILDDRDALIASPSTGEADATTLTVYLGYKENGLYEQGTFACHDVRYTGMPRSMIISGSSFGFTNNGKAPIVTSYDNMTLGDIIGQIAASAGVTANVTADLASKAIPYLNQHESSLHLLQELERRFDGLAKFADGRLSFTSRDTGQNVSGASLGTFVLGPSDLASWDITESQRSAYSKVRAGYWDKVKNQLVWLQSTVTARSDSTKPFMLGRAYASQVEAQAAADAMMSKLNRGLRNGNLTLAKGDPSIRGGQGFAIQGVRDGVDGSFLINTATHTFTRDAGLMTTIAFESPSTEIDFSSEQLAPGDTPEPPSSST